MHQPWVHHVELKGNLYPGRDKAGTQTYSLHWVWRNTIIQLFIAHTHTHKPVEILFFGLQEVDCVFDWLCHQNTDIKRVLHRETERQHINIRHQHQTHILSVCSCVCWTTYHNWLTEILIHSCPPQGREVNTVEGGLVPGGQSRKLHLKLSWDPQHCWQPHFQHRLIRWFGGCNNTWTNQKHVP